MNWENIDNGLFLDDPDAEPTRDAFGKTNDGFNYIFPIVNGSTKVFEVFRQFIAATGTFVDQARASINAGDSFTIPAGYLGVVTFVTTEDGGLTVTKRSFLLKNGARSYGSGEVTVGRLLELAPVIETVEASNIYELGNIGTADVHTFVNGSGPYVVNGLTLFKATQNDEDKVWLFSGGDGNYGDGATQTTADMFIDLGEQDPIPAPTVNYLPTKTISTTPYEITPDDLNRPLIFTSNDQVVDIPQDLAGLAASQGLTLFDFKANFNGTGTHTVNYPDTESQDFEQGALIYALCIDESGNTVWVVKEIGKDSGIPTEEQIIGTAIEDAAVTGTYDLDLDTFSDALLNLTGNTTITVSNLPSADESFVKTLEITSDTGVETLTLPVSWTVLGTYEPAEINYITIKFSNYTTAGAKVLCEITQ